MKKSKIGKDFSLNTYGRALGGSLGDFGRSSRLGPL